MSIAFAEDTVKTKQRVRPANKPEVYDVSVPKPTLSEVRYGKHERHILDFWKAASDKPTPLVFVIHGGGWSGGSKERVQRFADVQKLLDNGISVVAINYRLMKHVGDVTPPVKVPLHDAARALQFVRSKAGEWNIDKKRIGAAGGSAGACSSLWLAYHDDLADPEAKDPVARESTRLWCAAVVGAQTSLDPRQVKQWIPNITYGGHAFGKKGFAQFLAERESILPWIAEYSPYALVSKDDPAVYIMYSAPPAVGKAQKNATHSANFGVMLQKRCKEVNIGCDVMYPGAVGVKHKTTTDYLVWSLKGSIGWQGDWIGVSQDSQPNSWYCFRNEIELDKSPKEAVAKIACDSKYWLWVNGEMVVFEGQLKRGPNPKDTYYDEVDLAKYLKKGKNTFAVLVWYWGKHGFSHNSSGKAGLVFDANVDGKSLVSNSSWKVVQHPAYGSTDKPHPNYRLAEANIKFDASKDIDGWQRKGFDASGWASATEFGKPPVGPWNNLEKRPVFQWKNSGLIDYEKVEAKIGNDGSQTVIGKLPYNCHVTPYLKVEAPAGKRIGIQTDNYMGGGSPNVRAVYITKGGVQEYESFGWMNGHDVRYLIPDEVEVLEVKYRQTGYNADFDGSFECDDEKLNLLWERSKRTLYVTMRDNYMDCPDRERAQWWGDMVNEMGEAFYVFDAVKGPLLAKKGIYELARWHRKDKVIFSPVPAGVPDKQGVNKSDGSWDRELPRQMLASIGTYGFWTYYWYTGDKQTIVDVYPHVRNYLSLWKIGDDGLIIHRKGDWDWTDWGNNKDVAVLENSWVYLAFRAAVEMAGLSGNTQDIAGYKAKMNSIRANYNKTFWQGDLYSSPGHKGQIDDRAQAMAVVAGFAKPEYYSAIKKVLLAQEHASPYMEKYVLESLYMMGAADEAIARMKKRWAEQLNGSITTLWEGWGIGKKGFGGGTYNHAWSGGPLTVLSQYGAGVAPTKPGFKEFAVLPQMGPLKQIDTVVPTKYGDIKLKLENDKNFIMELTVPEGTTAVFGIPMSVNPSGIQVNGKYIYKFGRAMTPGFVGKYGRWIRFAVEPGQWKIEAEKPDSIDVETVKKWSAPYRGWHYYPDHVIAPKPNIKGYEDVTKTDVPTVFQVAADKKWYMTFIGFDGKGYQSFIAESDDLVNWGNMRLAMGYGPKDSFDYGGVVLGAYLYENYDIKAPRTLKKKDGKYYSLYGAYPRQGGYELRPGYEGVASSVDGITWKRAKDEPILSVHQADCGEWEKSCIYQPWLVEYKGKYYNFYNAANGHIEQMGLALSDDILNWKRYEDNPVIPNGQKGSYNEKFSSDGKVFWEKDHWVSFFFGVGKGGAHIMAAYSRDLKNWEVDPEPLYKAGGNPSGLDKKYAHKISLVWNPENETYYMYYNAVGNKGRGIGLITSKPIK